VLDAAGYASLFVSGNWREDDERKAIETLMSRRVDGLIVFAGRLSDAALKRYAAEVPLVLVGRRSPGRQFLSIGFDNRLGAHLAAEHLLSLGHRQIAFITGAHQHADALERRAGFEETLQAAGLKLDPDLVAEGAYTEPSGQQAAQALLARGKPFTALFASNDQMAIGAALALHRAGLRVPQDVSLVGFDDVAVAEFSIPPLTTVRQSVGEIGAQAATALLDLLADRPPRVTLTPPRLVVRESTAAPRKR
jgi:LacI family transcriptional regulator